MPERLRFLYGNDFKHKEALAAIFATIKWRKETIPIQMRDLEIECLRSGFMTVYGRDKYHRPILMMRPHALPKDVPQEVVIRAASFIMYYTRENMLKPGTVESVVMLGDYNHLMPWSLPISML